MKILRLFFFLAINSPLIGYCGVPDTKSSNFLVISDIHLNVVSTHLMDISPSTQTLLNDLDLPTFNALMLEIQQGIKKGIITKPKFIIILGDLTAHHLFSSDAVINNESYVFDYLKKNFPSTPILYTFGNNDSLGVDYGSFSDSRRRDALKSPYDVALKNGSWGDGFLSTGVMCQKESSVYPCIVTEDTTNGYYSVYLEPNLQLIAVNSVMFSPRRMFATQQAPMDQLRWLQAELLKAQKNNDRVIITMHIPPGNNVHDGSPFWVTEEAGKFLNIVNTFHETIIGILSGHTHKDELKIITNNEGKRIAGVYYTAALSTIHANAPSVKTFFLSDRRGNWQLTNYETFYFIKQNTSLVLGKLYDYKSYYCGGQELSLLKCLGEVTVDKMQRYFSAGNPNYSEKIPFPKDMVCTVPIN